MTAPGGEGDTTVQVVGIGADGWDCLPAGHRAVISAAEVLLGGDRQLSLMPDSVTAVRRRWPSPLRENLPGLLGEYAGRRVVALASGDPLLSGVGGTLVNLLGPRRVQVHPTVSSAALARARMGWSAESADLVRVVGRDPSAVLRILSPGRRIVVLSSDGATPASLATLLDEAGYGPSMLTVLSDLGGPDESAVEGTAAGWGEPSVPRLNVLCVRCEQQDPSTPPAATVAGLPDDAYEHDGQLTKRDLRAAALARLAPVPGQLLWDVGAGAGSVAIEWMRADPRCAAVAVESDPDRAERIRRNAGRLGVPGLEVRCSAAPDALAGLADPDAVFVGGGGSTPGVLQACWDALDVGGRLVAHAVTLETEAVVTRWHSERGGELTRISVERAAPIGTFTGWSPARPVLQWAAVKTAAVKTAAVRTDETARPGAGEESP